MNLIAHSISNTTISLMISLEFDNNSTFKSVFANVYSWSILSLSFFVILGFVGNLLVCMSIKIYPKLQAASNYYLFSLAATDLLVSVVVVPLAIIKNLFTTWILGYLLCTIWIFLDVFLCTASIFLLCVIACDRYVGIKQPFKRIEKSKSKIRQIIFVIASISLVFSCPILILAYFEPENIFHENTCVLNNNYYMVYGSIFSFIIPLFIMITMYCLTVRRLRIVIKEFNKKRKKKNHMHLELSILVNDEKNTSNNNESITQKNESETAFSKNKTNVDHTEVQNQIKKSTNLVESKHLPIVSSSRSNFLDILNKTMLTKSIINDDKTFNTSFKELNEPINMSDKPMPTLSANCLKTGSSLTLDTGIKNSDQHRLSLRNIFGKKSSVDQHSLRKNSINSINKENSFSSTTSNSKTDHRVRNSTDTFRSIVRTSMLIKRVIENFKIGRETAVVKNEQKAVKVLGIVVLVFVLAWAPFAFLNILIGLEIAYSSYYHSILNLLSWPGYISSVINPLIYSAFNENFRFAFKKILLCNYNSLRNNKYKIDSAVKMNLAQSITSSRDRYLFREKSEYKKFLKKNINV